MSFFHRDLPRLNFTERNIMPSLPSLLSSYFRSIPPALLIAPPIFSPHDIEKNADAGLSPTNAIAWWLIKKWIKCTICHWLQNHAWYWKRLSTQAYRRDYTTNRRELHLRALRWRVGKHQERQKFAGMMTHRNKTAELRMGNFLRLPMHCLCFNQYNNTPDSRFCMPWR